MLCMLLKAPCIARHQIPIGCLLGCMFRGTKSDVDTHKGCCSCSSELHIQTVTMAEVRDTVGDVVASLQVCVQLKQLKMSQVELQQQLLTLNKQCLLLQEDNEKLLSVVDEQAKYETSGIYCMLRLCLCD